MDDTISFHRFCYDVGKLALANLASKGLISVKHRFLEHDG